MAALRLLPVLFITLCCVGCVSSVHPLYSKDVLASEPSLLGTWKRYDPVFEKDDESTLTFTQGRGRAYELAVEDRQGRVTYDAHLVRLDDSLYLDLYPKDLQITPRAHALDVVRVHHFCRVSLANNVMRSRGLDSTQLRTVMEKQQLPHTSTAQGTLLTASTPELQEFFRKHGETVFSASSAEFHRQPIFQPLAAGVK